MSQAPPPIVVHADMDAFYAAVEQLDDPSLRGKPIIVGPRSRRGVVLTASYEARPFRVGSAMPMVRALERCPQAIVVPPRFERYVEVSRLVMATLRDFSPRVEPLSLDEAFLDMSGAEGLFGPPREMGRRIKDAVFEATGGLTISVGVSGTKYVAKVASDYDKPDGLTVVPPQHAVAFLAPLPIRKLWGCGPKTSPRLEAAGLHTIGDVARADPAWLEATLGSMGLRFHHLANARDARRVSTRAGAVSIGSERTLEEDVSRLEDIQRHLRASCDQVGRRLRSRKVLAGGVRVKLKGSSFTSHTRQMHLHDPTDVADHLYRVCVALLDRFEHSEPYRLVGVAAYDLVDDESAPRQLHLFDHIPPGADSSSPRDPALPRGPRRARLEAVLDEARKRYGKGTLQRAESLEHGRAFEGSNKDYLDPDLEG